MSGNIEVVDSEYLELGRRITEALEEKKAEKGDAFSIRAFAKRIGMNYETLRLTCRGERPVRPSELEKIAEALGTTVARLKKEDTKKVEQELHRLIKKRTDLHRALQIAQTLVSSAIGYTEQFESRTNLGVVYYQLNRFRDALEAWSMALPYAKSLHEMYDDLLPLSKVTTNLILLYTRIKDYSALSNFLSTVDETLEHFDNEYAGTLHLSHAIAAHSVGDLETCREKIYKHLHYQQLTESARSRGIGLQNVGYVEYLLGNYMAAKEYFEKAIECLEDELDLKYISVKDYAKCILKLKQTDKAIQLIEQSLQELNSLDLPVIHAKLLLLHATTTNKAESADSVLAIENAGEDLHKMACDFLMKHYAKLDDSPTVLKYYKIAEKFATKSNWEGI